MTYMFKKTNNKKEYKSINHVQHIKGKHVHSSIDSKQVKWYGRSKGVPYSNKSNKTGLSPQNVHVHEIYRANDQMTVIHLIHIYEVNGFSTSGKKAPQKPNASQAPTF